METNGFSRLEFIKSRRPQEPFSDWRVYSLLLPAIASAIGFFVFAILGYSFTEFSMITDRTRFVLVIVGGICLAIGGEVGTLTNTIEIFRKQKLGKVNFLDWVALFVSLVTTLASFVLAFAALLGERANWSTLVQVWGAIVIGGLCALDAYGGFLETGYLFADYETRIEKWYKDLQEEQARLSTVDNSEFQPVIDVFQQTVDKLLSTVDKLQNDVEYLQYPVADLQWFKAQVSSNNGHFAQYKEMNALDAVKEICRVGGRRFDSTPRTANNWHKELTK